MTFSLSLFLSFILFSICLVLSDLCLVFPCFPLLFSSRAEGLSETAALPCKVGVRVSKAKMNEYAENIEGIAAKLAVPMPDVLTPEEPLAETSSSGTPKAAESVNSASEGLRRRFGVHSNNEERSRDTVDSDQSPAVKLDDAARTHIEKYRKLQEDLTDEIVDLAQQLRESSLMMNQSIKNTEKILDSTEKAVGHSLASTGHATSRAMDVYSRSFKTTWFQWLLIFAMTLVFVMLVLLIRVT